MPEEPATGIEPVRVVAPGDGEPIATAGGVVSIVKLTDAFGSVTSGSVSGKRVTLATAV
jgi:hypothetical protein